MQLDPLPKEGGGIDQVVMGKLGCNLRLPAGGHDTTPFSPSTQGCGNDAPLCCPLRTSHCSAVGSLLRGLPEEEGLEFGG